MNAAFLALKTEADKKGIEFTKLANEWAEARNKLEETVTTKNNDLVVKDKMIQKLQGPDPSDIDFKFKNWNPAKMADMGISDRQVRHVRQHPVQGARM